MQKQKNTKRVFVVIGGCICQGIYCEKITPDETGIELETIVLDKAFAIDVGKEDTDFLDIYEENYKIFSEMIEQDKLDITWF